MYEMKQKVQLNRQTPCVLLLGGFDGAHVGHKQLFEKAKS